MSGSTTQRILWVLWPSFLVAAAAELLVFAVIDPADLHLLGAASAALTVFLQRSPVEVNRCPLDADDRPAGCPKQAGAQDAAG